MALIGCVSGSSSCADSQLSDITHNETYRAWGCFGRSTVRRCLATVLGAFAVGGAVLSIKSAAADPVAASSPLPSGDFVMGVTFCPGSISFSECQNPTVNGGVWIFNSDGSVTRVSNGVISPGHGLWDEVAPGQIFAEFFSEDGFWIYSVLANQISGGDYPCFEGPLDDLDIGVLSVRLCLEP